MSFILPKSIIPPLYVDEDTPSPKTISKDSETPSAPKKTPRSKKEEVVITLEEAVEGPSSCCPDAPSSSCCPVEGPSSSCCPDAPSSSCCPEECSENEKGRDDVHVENEETTRSPVKTSSQEVSAEELERTKTLKQLRDTCNDLGLSAAGKKGELARRICSA
jgi:hypothetical protein